MSEKVSMSTIAKILGVSKNTVSLALRGVPGISGKTRKMVLDTAAELGYKYASSGKKAENAKNLCLVVPKSAQDSIDFFGLIQMGIEDEAKKNNMNVILHYYDENGQEFETPLCIKDGMISGIITLGRVSKSTVRALEPNKLPIIMVDNYFDDLDVDCILTDNHSGGYKATEYLLKNGHTRIGFFGNIKDSVSFYDRYMGYRKAMEINGVRIEPSLSLFYGYSDFDAYQENIKALGRMKSKDSLPSAYVCCNDASAISLYKMLKQLDVSIPGHISVIGFDDIGAASDVSPELTTMRVNKEWMGRKAVSKLIHRLKEQELTAEKLLLSAKLVERNSVGNIQISQ
jgi:LacI family transcriptional regulator